MSDWIQAYETYLKMEKRASANTVSSYLRDVRQFADDLYDRDIALTDALPRDIRAYTDELTRRGSPPPR